MLGRGMATAKAKAAKESKGAAKGAKESKSPEGASGGALAALHGVFESERATCIAIDAFPAGDDRLFLAVEAIEPQLHGKSASAILAVTLGKKPTFEVLHASARSAHDYLYDEASDTHFLLQGGGLLRLRAGVESFTPLDQSLDRIALAGDTVVACGGTEVVAITEAGKVERIPVETAFELRAIVSDGERLFAAGRGGVFFVGDRRGLEPVKLPANAFKLPHADGRLDILSLHPTPDGALLIGGRDGAARYEGGAVSMLELDHYGTWGRAACVDGATELYAVEHRRSDEVVLHRRVGTALPPVARAKFKAIRSRQLPHASTRMHARGDVLVVSINDAVHIRTGGVWRQIKIVPDATLLKAAPAAMKAVEAPAPAAPRQSPTGVVYDQPRSDGLYVVSDVTGSNIVRFLGDGTVLTASTMPEEKLKNVLKWLKPSKSEVPAPVTLAGDRISWTSNVTVTYSGTWSGEQLQLEVVSSNGHSSTRRYDFYPEDQIVADKRAK